MTESSDIDRRRLLQLAGSAAVSASLAGCEILPTGDGGQSTGPEEPDVYAVDPAPVVEGRHGEVRSVFLDVGHRRVDSTVGDADVINHAVSYGHTADEGPPEAPWTPPRLTAGVLSTPSTVAGGESENPLATKPLSELLTSDEGAPLRRTIGLGSDDEWVMSPTEVDTYTTTALETDTEVHAFVGVAGNRPAEAQAQGVTPPPRIGVVSVYVFRISVDATTVVFGLSDGWKTQSLEPEDLDEQNSTRDGIIETATKKVEKAKQTVNDSGDSLTKDDEDDGKLYEAPPDPEEETVEVSLASPARLIPPRRRELGYPDEYSGTLENTSSYVTGRTESYDVFNWNEEEFERGTRYNLDIETVTRSYTLDGDDSFPFCAVTAPLADRDGEERNPLATEDLRDLLVSSSFEEGVLNAALETLDLFDGRNVLVWDDGPTDISSGSTPSIASSVEVAEFEGVIDQITGAGTTPGQKAIEVHVARKTDSDRVTVGVLANVTSGDDYWDDRETARELFTAAMNGLEFGAGSLSVDHDVGVKNLQLVQTVADTRVQDSGGSNVPFTDGDIDDVDLVADENVAPLFDLDVPGSSPSHGTDPIPRHAVLEFDVDGQSALLRTRLDASALNDLKTGLDTGVMFDRNAASGTNELPVFRIATDTASVSMDARAPSGYTYDSRTLNEGSDYAVAEVEPLRVGFIPVVETGITKRYGGQNGFPDSYDDTVQMAVEYLRRTYPGKLYAYQMPLGPSTALEGKDPDIELSVNTGKIMLEDFRDANMVLQMTRTVVQSNVGTVHALGGSESDAETAIAQNGYHATVAIVPQDYFAYYGRTFPFSDIDGLTLPAPNAAVGVRDGEPETVAHELGHKFVADPYEVAGRNGDYPMAQRSTDLTFGSPARVSVHHARARSNSDPPAVLSHGFDLTGGSFRIVEDYNLNPPPSSSSDPPIFEYDNDPDDDLDLIHSLMSYWGGAKWADERILQTLINNDWNRADLARWMFSATGTVDDDGEVSLTSTHALRNHPVVQNEGSADDRGKPVRVEMVTPDGETIASREVIDAPFVHHLGNVEGFVNVDIPFPLETAELRATRAGNETTFNPIVRPVRDAVDRVPDRGIEGDPEATRDTVEVALDEVATLMDASNYEGAADRMSELREPIAGRFLGDYGSYINQPTSEELLDLVDRMIERLRVLAEYGGEPTGDRTTVSKEITYEGRDLSDALPLEVTEESRFQIEFEVASDCPFDVFVLTGRESMEYNDLIEENDETSRTELKKIIRPFVREHSPSEVTFIGAQSGSGETTLSPGHYGIWFHKQCDRSHAPFTVSLTADIGAGEFQPDDFGD